MSLRVENDPAGGVRLWLKVVPGASRDRIVGALGDALKISVTKPPADGQANRAVIDCLAAALGVGRQQIEIVGGASNPRKQIRITGLTAQLVAARLGDVEARRRDADEPPKKRA